MTEHTPEGKLLDIIRKGQAKVTAGRELKIFTKINIILMVIIAAVAVIFIADVFIFKEKPLAVPVAVENAVKMTEEINVEPELAPEKTDEPVVKKVSREEILGNLNLLGIITGDNNQAIVEDKALKKTFFLYKGDSLGELKVYDIKESMLILDFEGERIELKI